MAKIGLEDVRFNAPHGYYTEEHLTGNEFSIDVWVETDIGGAAVGDDLGQTVSYSTIYYLLQLEMKKPAKLLETLAQRMADRIQDQFPRVKGVTLKLRKLNPPLGGQVAAAFVEVSSSSGSGIIRPDKEKDVYDEEEDEEEYYEDDEGYDDYGAY